MLLTGLLLSVLKTYSQGKFGHVPPQTADFMRYGDMPLSLFAGKMNLEVPICRIKDQDFDIPVSLLYAADGFNPEKRSDFVGLDWTLIAGGCITREIYGIPDDFKTTSSGQETGFLWVSQNAQFQDRNKIWNMDPSAFYYDNLAKSCHFSPQANFFQDSQPDLFMFNFNGHSGHFMIDNKGKGQANHSGYKVDLSGLTGQNTVALSQPTVSTLRITTPDGYLYEFGGSLDAMEYSISYKEGHLLSAEELNPTILAWRLSKITAPNGRIVTFNYVPEDNTYYSLNPIWQASRGKMVGLGSSQFVAINATKKTILKSIEADNVKVEFKNSLETTLGTGSGFFYQQETRYNCATYQNENRYSCILGYENQSKRRFLSSVTCSNTGKYSFEYNHTNYPTNMSPLSASETVGSGIDDFGYWKNNNSDSSYGLMSKVTYPTGGYSSFTYERHQYNKIVEYKLSDLSTQLSVASDQILYGARIKTITGYAAPSLPEMTKEYIYAGSINNDVSSGILYQSRPYTMIASGQKIHVTDGSWNKNYNVEESPIGYSSVIEKQTDGSYTHYKFTDYLSSPALSNNVNINIAYPNIVSNFDYLASFCISRVTSNAAQRGLLIEKLIFDSDGLQKAQEQNLFKNVSIYNRSISLGEAGLICDCNPQIYQVDSSFIVSFIDFYGGGVSRKIYLKTYPQVQQKIKVDNVVSEEWYRYNHYDQLRSKSIVINQTDTLRTDYIYPTECSDWYCLNLTAKNRLTPVIEQATYRANASVSPSEIERIHTDYKFVNPSDTLLLVPNTIQSMRSGSNQWQIDLTCDFYNEKGNVLQQTGLDNVAVAFLWGYKNQYPVAEIRNATYAQVEAALGQTAVNRIANADILSASDAVLLNNLRTNANLSNALVTTYTYSL
jgi:hypothetical protein